MHGDGLTAINFEHAWGDGVAILRMMQEVFKDSCANHWVHPDTQPSHAVDTSKFVEKIGQWEAAEAILFYYPLNS